MSTTLILRDKTYLVQPGITIRLALTQIGVDPQSVLPTREGELVSEDEPLREGDMVKLVAVISGGD